MRSALGAIRAAAAAMVSAANAAVRAKAKIASPSKVFRGLGEFTGEGYAVGISAMERDVSKAADNLVAIPQVATPNLTGSFNGEMNADYDYYRNAEYVIYVPLNVDGREFAHATATYTQQEIEKQQTRNNRKYGKL